VTDDFDSLRLPVARQLTLLAFCLSVATMAMFSKEAPVPLSNPVVVEAQWNGTTVRMLQGALRVRIAPGYGLGEQALRDMGLSVRVIGYYVLPNECITVDEGAILVNPTQERVRRVMAERQLVRTFDVAYDDLKMPLDMARHLMSKYPGIEYAEPWYVDELHAGPNDPLLTNQSGFERVKGSEAWEIFKGDSSIVIGISDSGLDPEHPDLAPSIHRRTGEIPNNGIDDDANGYVDDYEGYNFTAAMDNAAPGNVRTDDLHGIEVAGLAAAATNNGIGMASTGFRSKLFPIKIVSTTGTDVVFGYQSILYAARLELPVLNCSWGSIRPRSSIEQSLIDYALSRGTVVVASSGNYGNALDSRNYPAAYDGVIGVGEVSSTDVLSSASGLGANAALLAPSRNAITTTSGGEYTSSGITGTSFAAPMVAGMAAVVRARHPALTARQVGAFLRRSVDDVRSRNSNRWVGLPGRMNMLKAVTLEPSELTGVEILESQLVNADGSPTKFLGVPATVQIKLDVENLLWRDAANVVIRCTTEMDNGWNVQWTSNEVAIAGLTAGARKTTSELGFTVGATSRQPLVILAEIVVDDEESQWRYLVFDPIANFRVVENQTMAYGVGSHGALVNYAASVSAVGPGFFYKPAESLASQSGFAVVSNRTQAATALTYDFDVSDFTSERFLEEGGITTLVLGDNERQEQLRTHIQSTLDFRFPSTTVPLSVVDVVLKNQSSNDVVDVGGGFIVDWDLSNGGRFNSTRTVPEAIPDERDNAGTAAQAFWRDGFNVAVVAAVTSNDPSARAQSGGDLLPILAGSTLSAATLNSHFVSGTTYQTQQKSDLAGLHGMHFAGVTAPGVERRFSVIFGLGQSVAEATARVRAFLTTSDIAEKSEDALLVCTPVPADQVVYVRGVLAGASFTMYDMQGSVVKQGIAGGATLNVALSDVAPGVYSIVSTSSMGSVRTATILVNR